MSDLFMLGLFLLAIAIGFLLGYRGSAKKNRSVQAKAWDKIYFKGLNLLLN